MKRAFTPKVESITSCTADNDALAKFSAGKLSGEEKASQKPISPDVNRRSGTSAALIGLAISMGASSLLMPQPGDNVMAAESVASEPTAAQPVDATVPAVSVPSIEPQAVVPAPPAQAVIEPNVQSPSEPNLVQPSDRANSGSTANPESALNNSVQQENRLQKSSAEWRFEESTTTSAPVNGATQSPQQSGIAEAAKETTTPAVTPFQSPASVPSSLTSTPDFNNSPVSAPRQGGSARSVVTPIQPFSTSVTGQGEASIGITKPSAPIPLSGATTSNSDLAPSFGQVLNSQSNSPSLPTEANRASTTNSAATPRSGLASTLLQTAVSNSTVLVEAQTAQAAQTPTQENSDLDKLKGEIFQLRQQYQAQSTIPANWVAQSFSIPVPIPANSISRPTAFPSSGTSNASSIQLNVPPPENNAVTNRTQPNRSGQNQNITATSPSPASDYNQMIPLPVGEPLSPELPDLPGSDNFLPNTPSQFTGYIWPARGTFTSGYGRRWGRMHRGIDIAGPVGTPIVAAAPGVVVRSGWNSGGYGNLVDIRHADGSLTRYAHNHRLLVRAGEEVQQGQQIAELGNTGRSTGPHLHFEIHSPGRGAVNPVALLPRRTSS